MNLKDIKNAVDAGKTVHWANTSYVVRKDRLGQYLIVHLPNGSAIGLTNRAGDRLNGRVGEFFVPVHGGSVPRDPDRQRRGEGREKGESELSVLRSHEGSESKSAHSETRSGINLPKG